MGIGCATSDDASCVYTGPGPLASLDSPQARMSDAALAISTAIAEQKERGGRRVMKIMGPRTRVDVPRMTAARGRPPHERGVAR